MGYNAKYLAILAVSSVTALGVGIGCSREDGDGGESSTANATEVSDLVISQVYGGGGNGGVNTRPKYDYVELFNRGTTPIPLKGKALQYAPKDDAFSATSNLIPLPDDKTIEPKHYFLVQLKGGTDGADLSPAADFVTGQANTPEAVNLGNNAGKIAIVANDAPLDACGGKLRVSADAGTDAGAPAEEAPACTTWIDLLGYGAASQAEGEPRRGASNTNALFRNLNGCADTNNNSQDFAPGEPKPRSSASAAVDNCPPVDTDAGPPPPPPGEDGGTEAGPDAGPGPGPGPGPGADKVLLNEILINPPGGSNVPDAPWEFIEIACTPKASLAGYWFVAVEGDGDSTAPGAPGMADLVIDLGGTTCGKNGLVYIKAKAGGHASMSADTTVIETPLLDQGGPLENSTTSFLIIKSATAITKGTNYDEGKTGTLALPEGAKIVDGFATFDQKEGVIDLTYAPRLTQKEGASPDGATRIPGNTKALEAAAWYSADLMKGDDPKGLSYDSLRSSTNFPREGFKLTPGAANDSASPGSGQDGTGRGDPVADDGTSDPGSPAINPPGSGGKKKEPTAVLPPTDTGSRSACAMTHRPATGNGMLAALGALGLAIASIGRRRRK
jgi:hypothetical protein